jgi:hypothetical protein
MSQGVSLYVGPYAMWVGPWKGDLEADPEALDAYHSMRMSDGKAEIEPNGPAVEADLFIADSSRPDGPKRLVLYTDAPSGGFAGLDLGAIDRRAEVAAFRRAYRRELVALERVAGGELVVRWGVIFSYY